MQDTRQDARKTTLDKLYDALTGKGYSFGSREQYDKGMQDADYRRELYNFVSKDYNLGSFEEYEAKVAPKEEDRETGMADFWRAGGRKMSAMSLKDDAAIPLQARQDGQEDNPLPDKTGDVKDEAETGTPKMNPPSPLGPKQEKDDRSAGERFMQALDDKSKEWSRFHAEEGLKVPYKADERNTRPDAALAGQYRAMEANREQVAGLYDEIVEAMNRRGTELDRQALDPKNGWMDVPRGTGGMVHTYNTSTFNGRRADEQWRTLAAARNAISDARKTIEEADRMIDTKGASWWRDTFVAGAARGFGDKLFDLRTWDYGITELSDNLAVASALDDYDKGKPLTKEQEMLLDALSVKMATDAYFGSYLGRGYKAGAVTAESLPFMLEMMINPAAKIGTTVTSKLARYAIKRFGKAAAGKLAQKAVRAGARVAGDAVGSAVMAGTTGAVGVTADALDRMTPNVEYAADEEGKVHFTGHDDDAESPFTAFAKAFGARAIENHSEMIGNYFAPIGNFAGKMAGKGLEKVGLGSVSRWFTDLNSTRFAQTLDDFQGRTHWDGVTGEFMEEVVGGIENALVVGDQTLDTDKDTGVFNKDNLIDTFLGVGLMSGIFSAMNTASYRTPKYRARQRLDRADNLGGKAFGEKNWGLWKEMVERFAAKAATGEETAAGEYGRLSDLLYGLTKDPDGRQICLDYLYGRMKLQGIETAQARKREEANSPEENDLESSYENGRGLQGSEMHDAQAKLEQSRRQLKEKLDMEDCGTEILDDGNWLFMDQEQKDAAMEYLNAKATWEGMTDGVRDEMAGEVESALKEIESNVNRDDNALHPATTRYDHRKVYIVKGVIATGSNGNIDLEHSDKSIIVRDAVTGEIHFAALEDIQEFGETQDPEERMEVVRNATREGIATRAARMIDGILPFEVNDEYELTNGKEGTVFKVRILPAEAKAGEQADPNMVTIGFVNGDGSITAKQDVPKAVVQEMSEANTLRRLNEYEKQRRERQAAGRAEQAGTNDTGEQTAAVEAEDNGAPRRYEPDEELVLDTPEGEVRAVVTGTSIDNKGHYQVETERPVNGKRVQMFTQAELDRMVKAEETPAQEETDNDLSDNDNSRSLPLNRPLTEAEAKEVLSKMEEAAEVAPEVELTEENWISLFGEDGKVDTPVGTVKMGENQYFKLAQRGRDGKLGMVKPTLEHPDVIVEDERPAASGQSERAFSYVFVKTFRRADGSRYYYFTSVTVSKDGKEVVVSNQEKTPDRISKLLQQGKIAWIGTAFSLHPKAQTEESVPLDDSNRPTSSDNQSALLGIGSSEHSTGKGSNNGPNVKASAEKAGYSLSEEIDENGHPFVVSSDGSTTFGQVREESGLPAAPIKLSEGYQDDNGKGYGLAHIEANHGRQIKNAGFASVEDFVSYVAKNYDEDNIRVGKRRENGSITYLLQVTDKHDNTLFVELSRDGSYWNVNSAGIFRKGYSNKKETVVKTEPQQPNNASSAGSSRSADESGGIAPTAPNGKPTVSTGKVSNNGPNVKASAEKAGYSLSEEIDENGRPFVLTNEGDLIFGRVGEETGLRPAPILLSEGIITNQATGDGYGLVHIEARHGEQIRRAGYHSVVDFIEEVAKQYDVIKEGLDRNGRKTYRLLLTDRHNNTLMIELSEDGSYWNINTAGIFKTSYGRKNKEVYNRHTTAKQPAETVETSQDAEHSDTQTSSSMNVPTTSTGKGSNNGPNVNGVEEKKQTALSSIPVDDKGEPQFEQAPAAATWAALVELNGGDRAEARAVAEQMAGDAQKAYRRAARREPSVKPGSSAIEVMKARSAHREELKALQQRMAYWGSVAGYEEEQKRLAEMQALQAKRDRMAELRRELEKKGRYSRENALLGDPVSFRDYAMRAISTGAVKFVWGDDAGTQTKGLASHLGLSQSSRERNKRIWLLSNENGMRPERAAETLMQGYAEAMGVSLEDIGMDYNEALDEVLDILSSYDKPRDMFEAAKALRKDLDYEEMLRAMNEDMEETEEGTGGLTDSQGNPINEDGTLKIESVESVDELTDEDFTAPKRNVRLPELPRNVDAAIGADGKPVIIKKNIFEKNGESHKFSHDESRRILKAALYDTDLIGRTQPSKKPLHWVAIKVDEKSPLVVLEVRDSNDNIEVVGWYTLDERNLDRIKRQAEKNGGELVMLSPKDKVESLSTPPDNLLSDGKGKESNPSLQADGETSAEERSVSEDIKAASAAVDTYPTEAQKVVVPNDEAFKPVGKGLFGNIYDQFKGKANAAIIFLRKIKSGEAIGALHHKDVGDISLVWGNEKAGLQKIAKKHPEVLGNLQEIIDGMHVSKSSDNRIVLESDTHKAVISKKLGKEKTPQWLLTAYEKKNASDGSSDIDSEPKDGKQNGTAPLQSKSSENKGTTSKSEKQESGGEKDVSSVEKAEAEKPRMQKAEGASKVDGREAVLRDAVIDRLRESGMEVITDVEEGQRVLDMADGRVRLSAKKRRALETASLGETPRSLTVVSSADGAKVLKNIDAIADVLENSATQPKTFIGNVAKALGARRYGSASEYATFEAKNGKVVTIRLSDHNAKVSNFDYSGNANGISIVISPKRNGHVTNDGNAHIVEYYYDAIKLRRADGKPLADIVRSIKQALYSGEFEDTTGLAERQEVNGDEAEGQRVLDMAGGEARYMSFGEPYDYGTYPLGRVEPDLSERNVEIVDADAVHGFKNYEEAKTWAKQNVAKTYGNGETGGKGDIRISNSAIDKFMSQSAVDKSDSKDVHMAVLKVLPKVLNTSIDVETHPDFLKGEDGRRDAGNGINKDVLVHRCYGAVSIDGKLYSVKITLKEEVRNKNLPHNTHSYEATKIELLEGTLVKPEGDNPNTNNSISAAKLLKNVRMSYNPSEKVLDASIKRSGNIREHRVYHGSGADFTEFDHSHMGEGEGAQVYGWGTYVTEVEGIGRTYAEEGFANAESRRRDKGRSPLESAVGEVIWQEMYNSAAKSFKQRKETAIEVLEKTISSLEDQIESGYWWKSVEMVNENKAALEVLRSMTEEQYKEERVKRGLMRHLYTVEIPEDTGENYLDWANPLTDGQIDAVREYLAENYRKQKLEDFDASIAEVRDAPNAGEVNAWIRRGENVYKTLVSLLGTDKEASKALSGMDFTGIKYPADYQRGGREDGAKNYVIFNERDLKITDHVRFFRTADGQAYGFTVGGKIYIDPKTANSETPVHEYAHLWAEALRNGNRKEWDNVVGLMKGTGVWEEVKRRYPELETDDGIAEEVLAHYSGRRGAELLREEAKKIAEGNAGIFDKAAAISALQRVRKALSAFWKGVADFLHIHYTTPEEVADRVMKDLLDGVDPKAVSNESMKQREKEQIVAEAKANGTYLKAPNGEPTKLNEEQWVQVRTKPFKKWFGDWEKTARIEKLRNGKNIEVEYKNEYPLNSDDAQRWIKDNLRGDYTIDDTGEVVSITRVGAEEVTSHSRHDDAHLKSISAIPEILKNAIFLEETDNVKGNGKFDSYRYYAVGLNIDGEAYTAKVVIGVKQGKRYYDHRLTQIEKARLIDVINQPTPDFTTEGNASIPPYVTGKDSKLHSILQTDSSKVVDENGEPMVVYHGSRQGGFSVFDNNAGDRQSSAPDGVTFFSSDKYVGYSYSGSYNSPVYEHEEDDDGYVDSDSHPSIYACFLNIRNPYIVDFDGASWDGTAYGKYRLTDENGDDVYAPKGNHFFDSWDEAYDYANEQGMEHYDIIEDPWIGVDSNDVARDANDGYCDGAIIENVIDNGSYGESSPATDYITYHPNQIKSATDNNGDYSSENDDIRYQFVGERGAENADRTEEVNTRLENLRVAREMESAGKDAKAVKMATGWERGADGKWRYEIADARITDTLTIDGRTFDRHEADMLWTEGRLEDCIDAPELFSAYPELRDIRLKCDELTEDMPANGSYDSASRTITIHSDTLKYTNGILNHEIQHAIQDIEGFARGGNEGMFRDEERIRELESVRSEIEREIEDGDTDREEELMEVETELFDLTEDTPNRKYRTLAGEVEARNVQKRMGMTPEERRASIAAETEDVAREDQLFLYGDDVNESRTDNIEEVNRRFNEELQQQIDGKLADGHIYSMGQPGEVLLSTGVPNLPIQMSAKKLQEKATKYDHDFDLSEVRDLVNAMQTPLAVFAYGNKEKAQNIIVPLQKDGKNFIVGLSINPSVGGRKLEINSIRNVFPKDNSEWLNWISQDKALYLDKGKIQTLIDQQRTNLADVDYLDLDSVAKVVENFENPKTSGLLHEEGDSDLFRTDSGTTVSERTGTESGRMAARVRELAEKLHLDNVEIVTDASTLSGRQRTAKGFYNKESGKITVVVSNHADMADIERTVLHEAVAHHGLRELFGEHFDTFLDNVFSHAGAEVAGSINEIRKKLYRRYLEREMAKAEGVLGKSEAVANAARREEDFTREATEEYLASLAERTDFEKMDKGVWQRIKQYFMDMLHSLGLGNYGEKGLTDNELRYVLWRSYTNLKDGGAYQGIFNRAADVARQSSLKVGMYAESPAMAAETIEEANRRFNEELGRFSLENADKIKFKLGYPSDKLLAAGVANKPIVLHGSKVAKKIKKHGFKADELMDLPRAVANPIAVFDNLKRDGNRSVLTELRTSNGNFLVTIDLGKGSDADFDVVSSVFGKKGNSIAMWINKGYMRYVDKAKALDYLHLSAPIAEAIDKQELDSVAKIVENFENPKTEAENDSGGGLLYREPEEADYEKARARDAYERRMKSGLFQSREALQDSMLSLKESMDAILGEKTRVEDIDGFENAYLGENRMSSQNRAEIDAASELLFKPLYREVVKIAPTEKAREELIDYMFAKHGLERNAVFAERDAKERYEKWKRKHPDTDMTWDMFTVHGRDYSGLTALTGEAQVHEAEAVARRMVEEYEKGHDTEQLWKRVNTANRAVLKKQYESGLMGREMYDRISGMFGHYIPLQGFEETTSSEEYAYLTAKGGMYGRPVRAGGRVSKADNPFANMEAMMEGAIMRGNRNALVKQRFLNFVLNHPSDLVSVSDVWLKYDDVNGEWVLSLPDNILPTDSAEEVERKMQEHHDRLEALAAEHPDRYKRGRDAVNIPYRVPGSREMQEHQVVVSRGGRTYVLTVNGNPRLAQALNGLTNPDNDVSGAMGRLLSLSENLTRTLSAFYTTRNPDFILSNFLRDTLYSNTMVWIKESPNYALRYNNNWRRCNPKTMLGLYRKYRKNALDPDNGMEGMFRSFMMNGGETGYVNLKEMERRKKDISKLLKNGVRQPGIAALGRILDEMNRAIENQARFAAFVTSLQMGRTTDRAVYDAKEISVNFNKKGAGGKFVGTNVPLGAASAFVSGIGRAQFAFWNAAIQGTANFARQAGRHPGKALSSMAAMFALGCLIGAFGGGDDDEPGAGYHDIPKYTRRSNIVWKGHDGWGKLPLPVEYRAIYGLGELFGSSVSGKEKMTGGELAMEAAEQLSQILPLDLLEGGGGFRPFIPTWLRPAMDVGANRSWTGLPIYRDGDYNREMPGWTKAYRSTNTHLVSLAETINGFTGGTEYEPGAVDINPAAVEYLLNGYLGGTWSFIDKLVKSGETAFGDREYNARNTPLWNRVAVTNDERMEYSAVNGRYRRLEAEYDRTNRLLKKYARDTYMGVFDWSEKIDFLYNSKEFRHHELFEWYKPEVDAMTRMLKAEPDPKEMRRLEAELNEVKKTVIKKAEEADRRK